MHTIQSSLYFCMIKIKKFQAHVCAKKYESHKIHWKLTIVKSKLGLEGWSSILSSRNKFFNPYLLVRLIHGLLMNNLCYFTYKWLLTILKENYPRIILYNHLICIKKYNICKKVFFLIKERLPLMYATLILYGPHYNHLNCILDQSQEILICFNVKNFCNPFNKESKKLI